MRKLTHISSFYSSGSGTVAQFVRGIPLMSFLVSILLAFEFEMMMSCSLIGYPSIENENNKGGSLHSIIYNGGEECA